MKGHPPEPVVRWLLTAYRWATNVRIAPEIRARFGVEIHADAERLLRDSWESNGWRGLARSTLRLALDSVRRSPRSLPAPSRSRAEVRQGSALAGLGEDASFAMKSLRGDARGSAFLVGVLSLALSVNTLAFAIGHAYLLRPLPYPEADRLVSVVTWGTVTWSEVDDLFELAVSWDLDVFSMIGEPGPELAPGAWVTADFLEAYGVRPALGRTFGPDEVGAGGAAVAMISHRLWTTRFGSDPDIVGRTFDAYVSDRPGEANTFTIVGVLPADFWYVNAYTDVLAPIREDRTLYAGRLRPGVSAEDAQVALARLAEERIVNAPDDFAVTVQPLQASYVEEIRPTILALQLAAALVLLIAGLNASVLLAVRALRRVGDVRIRLALGASRTRVARQLVMEGLVLAAASGALAAGLTAVALDAGRELIAARLGRGVPGGIATLQFDSAVMAPLGGVILLVGLAFGLVQLIAVARALAATGRMTRRTTSGHRSERVRQGLVALQVAVSLSLLTGAGLMVRSAIHLQTRDLGFDPSRVTRGVVGLRASTYPEATSRHRFFDRLRVELSELPGVGDVALMSFPPFFTSGPGWPFETADGARRADAVLTLVSDGALDALGIRLIAGRVPDASDVHGGERAVAVSSGLADRLWPGRDPIGQRLREAARPGTEDNPPGNELTVVGVVADVAQHHEQVPAEQIYLSHRQSDALWMNVLVRAVPGSPPLEALIEEAVHRLDPDVPLSSVANMETVVSEARAPTRFLALLLGTFALFAFLLSVIGLYGVIEYATRQRRRDIAIRMAIGADRGMVIGDFFLRGLRVICFGAVLGSGGGALVGRTLAGQLRGVGPHDGPTVATVTLVLLLTAAVAAWLPARAAAAANPMRVLRDDG